MSNVSEDQPTPQRDSSGVDRAYSETLFDAPVSSSPPIEADLDPLPSPTRRAPTVDTGRLYRSAGAEGASARAALPALIEPPRVPASNTPASNTPASNTPASNTPALPRVTPTSALPSTESAAAGAALAADSSAAGKAKKSDQTAVGTTYGSTSARSRNRAPDSGLTFLGVAVIISGVTVILAIADIVGDRKLGAITGLGFIAACIYSALLVRQRDAIALLVVPPLAWLFMLLTVGQWTVKGTGSLGVREGLLIFEGLSFNAPWILIGTFSGVVIVVVRRVLARQGSSRQ